MSWETFTEYNQTGLEGLFTYPASVWEGFIPLTLFALFSIVLMSTFFSQKRLTGKGDFLASFAVASFFATVVSFIMSLSDGLVTLPTLITCLAVTIVAVILLLVSRDR